MKVTLEQLRSKNPCIGGYNRGIRLLQGKPFTKEDRQRTTYLECDHAPPVALEDIADRLGLKEALWATRCLEGHDRDLRLYGVWAVREIQPLLKDPRSWKVLDVAEAFANGRATAEELDKAREAAYAASDAASDAYHASYYASASASAAAAASAAAYASATSAASAAYAAYAYAAYAASIAYAYAASARKAAEAKQKAMFIKMCRGEAPWQTA